MGSTSTPRLAAQQQQLRTGEVVALVSLAPQQQLRTGEVVALDWLVRQLCPSAVGGPGPTTATATATGQCPGKYGRHSSDSRRGSTAPRDRSAASTRATVLAGSR